MANRRLSGALALGLAVALLASCSDTKRVETMETNQLNVSLEVLKQGTKLYALLRYTNAGKAPFPLERSLSGEEIPAGRPLFRLENDKGEEVAYVGMAAKRPEPHYPDDYVIVPPGAELRVTYPFDQEYGFEPHSQAYKMQYDAVNVLPRDQGLAFLKSNVASFSYP